MFIFHLFFFLFFVEKHLLLTEPPDNVTSGCHLFLSNWLKFSTNIKLPEQIVKAAEPLALVIDGTQLIFRFGKKMTKQIRITAITRLTTSNTIQNVLSMLFCYFFPRRYKMYESIRIFSVSDTHWTDECEGLRWVLNMHGWINTKVCKCVYVFSFRFLLIHKTELEQSPGYKILCLFIRNESVSWIKKILHNL